MVNNLKTCMARPHLLTKGPYHYNRCLAMGDYYTSTGMNILKVYACQ